MKKTIGVIFEQDTIDELENDAKKNGRLLSSHIRYIVECYLEKLAAENKSDF